jgi:hypothetical protein
MNQSVHVFVFGVIGSVSMEVLVMYSMYLRGRQWPQRYSQKGFWVVRSLIAFMGGLLAFAYGVENSVLALQIGAATPAILEKLGQDPGR